MKTAWGLARSSISRKSAKTFAAAYSFSPGPSRRAARAFSARAVAGSATPTTLRPPIFSNLLA